jgi:hypothetical protein
MKRALIAAAAAGAIGALGTAGLMAAAPASAAPDCSSFAVLQGRFVCLAKEQGQAFVDSANPVNQVNTFLHGTTIAGVNDGLGILDQPKTFVNSLKDFVSGPVSP